MNDCGKNKISGSLWIVLDKIRWPVTKDWKNGNRLVTMATHIEKNNEFEKKKSKYVKFGTK